MWGRHRISRSGLWRGGCAGERGWDGSLHPGLSLADKLGASWDTTGQSVIARSQSSGDKAAGPCTCSQAPCMAAGTAGGGVWLPTSRRGRSGLRFVLLILWPLLFHRFPMRTSSALRPFHGIPRLLLVLATATVARRCSRPAPPEEPCAPPELMTVGVGVCSPARSIRARCARVESRLGLRVAGKIVQRQAELGQRVKAGPGAGATGSRDHQLAAAAAR